jgi:hypothetical protein
LQVSLKIQYLFWVFVVFFSLEFAFWVFVVVLCLDFFGVVYVSMLSNFVVCDPLCIKVFLEKIFHKGEGGFNCNLEEKVISKDDHKMLKF